jgi:predicted small integral membrane protein
LQVVKYAKKAQKNYTLPVNNPGEIKMLRKMKVFLIGTVALWGLVGVLQNLLDLQGTLGAVKAATSMTTFEGGGDAWQATSNSVVVWAGALFIMLSKLTAAGLCMLGGWNMWQARLADAQTFNAAKQMALVGCGVAVVMLFGGFIVIAESWFELWRSEAMRGPVLESAFRYGGMIGLIAIFVAQRDD